METYSKIPHDLTIGVGVLTYNVVKTNRCDLLSQTLSSLKMNAQYPIEILAVNNGSTDQTGQLLNKLELFPVYTNEDFLTTSAHGNNIAAARVIASFNPDIVVLSDDDVEWHKGWAKRLARFWSDAPENVKLAGGHLEPEEYAWSKILGTDDIGGEHCLYRTSTGAATWSFRARDWPYIGPLPDKKQGWGDLPACERVLKQGFRIAQLDLATHIGEEKSSWGNRSYSMFKNKLDKKKWGF